MTPQDRLIEIAQRLDEMSGDGASELQTLSTELGEIAEKWPEPSKTEVRAEIPEWAREMEHMLVGFLLRKMQTDRAFSYRMQDAVAHEEQRRRYGQYRMTDRLDAAMMNFAAGGVVNDPRAASKIFGI